MEQTKEIKKILEKKLIGNDIAIADMILSYITTKCYLCNERKVNNKECYGYGYGRFNMCLDCIYIYNYSKCYKCEVYTNTGYKIGTNYKVCNGCSTVDCWCSK